MPLNEGREGGMKASEVVCVWKWNEQDSVYDTACGALWNTYSDFCPSCGREVDVKKPIPGSADATR